MANYGLETVAPPPLSPLNDVVISPANIAAEARQKKARRLTRRQRRAAQHQVRILTKQLKKSGYAEIQAVYLALKPHMEKLYRDYLDLKDKLQTTPDDPDLHARMEKLWQQLTPAKTRWEAVRHKYRQLEPTVIQRREAAALLKDHTLAVERERAEAKLRREMVKEAKIYEAIIIDKWTALGYCHRYQGKDGKEKVHKVQFAEIGITLDAIYFKIDASFKTAFGNWKTNIPQTVRVKEQLISASTLDELTIACQRQVTGVFSPDGAWVVVHRLDSVDGLLNYVQFTDVMERYPGQYHTKMPICVGVAGNRQVQWINLEQFPHWLIGGFTNSGKSNMVNVGVCTLITQQSPIDLRLVLIDLKGGLEFDYYRDIPHLHGQIVDSIEEVANSLAQLEAVMKSRFAKFRGIAKTISEYHSHRPADLMPRILVVFDEVASISSHGDLTKQIMASLRSLSQKGRAVGIHLWMCTQRPDTNAIDGSIKANLAVRISGRMPTSADSLTILGTGAAKDLAAIPGRMVMALGPDPVPIQAPHITGDDIQEALRRAKQYPTPPPLDVPDHILVIHQEWTVERIIELSIKHLGGNITSHRVYEQADNLSREQARKLVERIWAMKEVEFEGQRYTIQAGKGKTKTLVPTT